MLCLFKLHFNCWYISLVSKTAFYQELLMQTKALIHDETDPIANMANISALLFDALEQVNWLGFYRIIEEELVLGPFQGKVACIRIPLGKGGSVERQLKQKQHNVSMMFINLTDILLAMQQRILKLLSPFNLTVI